MRPWLPLAAACLLLAAGAACTGGEERGDPAIAIPVGDPPVGQITIGWSSNGCDYTVWVGPGLTLEEAIAYAQRY